MPPTESAPPVALDYESVRSSAAVFELERSLLLVTGPQRQKFLQGLLSNDVLARTPGQGCPAALMDAKGHIAVLLRVLVEADDIVLEVPAARRAPLEKTLAHYRVAAPVRFAPSDDRVMGIVGPRALDTVRALGADLSPLPAESHARVSLAGVDVRISRASDLPAGGYILHVPAAGTAQVLAALVQAGAAALGSPALDALRVEEGLPWYDVDVTEKNLLHETGLVSRYHSSTKGCYIGQEVVARLIARGGNVSQHLAGLTLEAARPAGTRLRAGDKDVGFLTTAAVSPRRGAIAMGYVHRSHLEGGTVLDAAGTRAQVTALPMVTS